MGKVIVLDLWQLNKFPPLQGRPVELLTDHGFNRIQYYLCKFDWHRELANNSHFGNNPELDWSKLKNPMG
jgi:hypothetical protein